MKPKTVSDVIKGRTDVYILYDDFSIHKAANRLERWAVRAAAVFSHQNKKLCGVLSQSDICKAAAGDRIPKVARISEFMSTNIISVTDTETIENCEQLMIENNIYHLVVLKNEEFLGLMSRRDVDRLLKESEKEDNKFLRDYIST